MSISRHTRHVTARLVGAGAAVIAALVGIPLATPVAAQTTGERPKVMIVLDASGSMRAQMQGRPRMDIAKDTLSMVLSEIPPEVDIGLIAYGHRERGSCTDIETIVQSGPARQTVPQILSRGRALRPIGKTPLTQAVRLAAGELKYTEDKATVILITDGIETCEADPCALGRELARDGVGFTAHVVGFGMTQQEGRQVACLAENTGGKYVPANNADELTDALRDLVNVEPEPEPEPVIQARPVHFMWRDTNGGQPLNPSSYQMVVRPLDGGTAPENMRPRADRVESSMLPGRYVALVQRKAERTVNARIEFEVPPGEGVFVVDRVIAARLRVDGVLTANGDVKTGNLHTGVGGSDPRLEFDIYPVADGAVDVGRRIDIVHSKEIAVAPGRYLVVGRAPGFQREKLVDAPAGETTVLRFDFDLAEVFIQLDDRDGFPRKRPLDLIFETMEGEWWSNQKHIVSGSGTRNNRPAPYFVPRGLWRIKAYDEVSGARPAAETIIEVTSTAQPITVSLRDGQTPDPQMLARFIDKNRVGCIQRLGGKSGCLVEAVTPDEVDRFAGVDPVASGREAAGASFDGTWFTTQGAITLVRDGRRVVGEWRSSGLNRVEARLSGDLRTLRGSWFSENTKAHGLFEARLSDDGTTFVGNWSRGDRPPSGSGWSGRRVSFGAPELRENPQDQSRFPEQLSNSAAFQKFISEVESQPDQVAPAQQPLERRGETSPRSGGGERGATAGAGSPQPAGTSSGWLTPRAPVAAEPAGMSCEDLRNKVAELMLSTNIARQQLLIGIGEREGFADGPPSNPADCARLARAFTAGGVPGFDVSPPRRGSDLTPPPVPTPSAQPQPERAQAPAMAPPDPPMAASPGRRESVVGTWVLERSGFKATLRVEPPRAEPQIGSYPPFPVEMRVESRPGDGCPKEPAWQAICRNVHQYGSYVGKGEVSAGAVVPSNDRRYLGGQLIGDVMLPIQISLDRGRLWVSLPKGEAWGEAPRGPAGWYNLRFTAIGETGQQGTDMATRQPSQDALRPATAAEFPGTTIWAIVDNEMDIDRVSNADRVERCRRDPRVGFGDGVVVHRRENPNWRPGQSQSPANPGRFLTMSVRECDRSGDMLECLEKPISPVDGQPMAEAARILQFRLEPHGPSGGVRACPVNAQHMIGGKQCSIALACADAELNVDSGGQTLLALVTQPLPGYPPRPVPAGSPLSKAGQGSAASPQPAGDSSPTSGAKWSCLYVNGQIALVNDGALRSGPTRNQALFDKVMRTLRTKGFMRADQAWGANPPTDQATCDRLGGAMSEAGIPGFEQPNPGTVASCSDLRAYGMGIRRFWEKFAISAEQRRRALDLPASLDSPDWTEPQCRAVGEHWATLGLPGIATGGGSQASPPTPAPQRRGDTGGDQRQPPPNRQAEATDARAVKVVENLYGEHIRRSKLGGSVLENVEMATRWGFARPVATVLVRNLDRIGSDPIFDAQDFDITQLSITLDPKPAPAGRIAVLAKFRNFGKATQLRYILHDAGQGPEIVDIEGANWRLRRLLRLDS